MHFQIVLLCIFIFKPKPVLDTSVEGITILKITVKVTANFIFFLPVKSTPYYII